MLGFVILIGTVVNNPILIVDRTLQLIRGGSISASEAILDAVAGRIRPIFMTTMTTLLGLLPLVLIPGAGSELYRGLGAVLLGGLLVSTVVTLVLVPVLLGLCYRLFPVMAAEPQSAPPRPTGSPPVAVPDAPVPQPFA
jgi:HAE1 family hydrophobic/amphiphilic exporter-1